MSQATFAERVAELKDFERETGQPLPMFPADIIAWEDMGYTVDLVTGAIYSSITVELEANAQAVAYLLSFQEGAVAI